MTRPLQGWFLKILWGKLKKLKKKKKCPYPSDSTFGTFTRFSTFFFLVSLRNIFKNHPWSGWVICMCMWELTNCHKLPQIATSCHTLSHVVTRCHKLSQVVTSCHRLSQVVTSCHKLSQEKCCFQSKVVGVRWTLEAPNKNSL